MAALALIVAGLALSNGALAFVGFALGIVFGGASLWARYSLRRVGYRRVMPEDHAFPGESISVTLRLVNRKPLPLTWIETTDTVPESGVEDEPLAVAAAPGSAALQWRTGIAGYGRVDRRISLKCGERGVYTLGPVELQSGDPFGLFVSERRDPASSRFIVYPRTVALPQQTLPTRRPFGERTGGLPVYEDPARVAGIRDYRPGDSMRRIDWNATARTGKLQSRVYEPTSSQYMLICVNTQTMEPAWAGYLPDLFEHGISVAASLARQAFDQRYAVGLLANASVLDADRAIRIPPGRRPEQLIRVLEALAVITPFVLGPLAAQIDREEHRLSVGTTIAVITAVMTDDLASTVRRLGRRGHAVVVLSTTGERWAEDLPAVPEYDVSALADEADVDSPWMRPAGTHVR
jgi:uncharacterized protein (DUF58 family)